MKTRILIASSVLLAAFANISTIFPAQAKTEKECAAEWKQMQAAKQTAGKKRKDFIAECRTAGASPAATTPHRTAPKSAATPAAPAPAVTGNAVFPSAISPKYANETPGRARLHTCVDQYNANKATNANGGLKWIQKGGGYWSLCDKRLKGQS